MFYHCLDNKKRIVNKVSKFLENVKIDTPEDEVRMLFKWLCGVKTKSNFKKIRRKRILLIRFCDNNNMRVLQISPNKTATYNRLIMSNKYANEAYEPPFN